MKVNSESFEPAIRAIAFVEPAMDTTIAVGELRLVARGRTARVDWRTRGWLTPSEYAEVTGTKQRTVRFWCARGWLETTRDGHDYRISVDTLFAKYPKLRDAA